MKYKDTALNIRIGSSQMMLLRAVAKLRGVKMSAVVREAIAKEVEGVR